jgi:hypothetical protein
MCSIAARRTLTGIDAPHPTRRVTAARLVWRTHTSSSATARWASAADGALPHPCAGPATFGAGIALINVMGVFGIAAARGPATRPGPAPERALAGPRSEQTGDAIDDGLPDACDLPRLRHDRFDPASNPCDFASQCLTLRERAGHDGGPLWMAGVVPATRCRRESLVQVNLRVWTEQAAITLQASRA